MGRRLDGTETNFFDIQMIADECVSLERDVLFIS